MKGLKWILRKIKNFRPRISFSWRLLVFACFFGCLSVSSSASADHLVFSVEPLASDGNHGFYNLNTDCGNTSGLAGWINNNGSVACAVQSLTISTPSGWVIYPTRTTYLKVTFYLYELRDREPINAFQNNSFSGSINIGGTFIDMTPVSFEASWFSEGVAKYDYIFTVPAGTTGGHLNISPRTAVGPNEWFRYGGVTLYGAVQSSGSGSGSGSGTVNTQAIVQAIQNADATSAINDKGDEIIEAIENQSASATERSEELSAGLQSDLENNEDLASIQGTATNFITIIYNFIGAISNPVIGTCILPVDLSNYDGVGGRLYEVDLCHLSPPAGVTNVLNVVFVLFVLSLATSAIRMIINLYKEVTNT